MENYGVSLCMDTYYCEDSHKEHCLGTAPERIPPSVDSTHKATAEPPARSDGMPPGFTIHDAHYDWDTNMFALNFTGRVNIWNMDVSNIHTANGVCALAFTWSTSRSARTAALS